MQILLAWAVTLLLPSICRPLGLASIKLEFVVRSLIGPTTYVPTSAGETTHRHCGFSAIPSTQQHSICPERAAGPSLFFHSSEHSRSVMEVDGWQTVVWIAWLVVARRRLASILDCFIVNLLL